MAKSVMVCGVDCHKGDSNCNGYCIGKADGPPSATPKQELVFAKQMAFKKLREAEKAWYEYFGLCDVGHERTYASDVYERVRNAPRR